MLFRSGQPADDKILHIFSPDPCPGSPYFFRFSPAFLIPFIHGISIGDLKMDYADCLLLFTGRIFRSESLPMLTLFPPAVHLPAGFSHILVFRAVICVIDRRHRLVHRLPVQIESPAELIHVRIKVPQLGVQVTQEHHGIFWNICHLTLLDRKSTRLNSSHPSSSRMPSSA